MTFDQLQAQIENYFQQLIAPRADFLAAIPVFTNNAELRIYRALDFLATYGQNTQLAFTAGVRSLALGAMPAQATVPKVFQGAALAYPYPVQVTRVAALVSGKGYVDYLRSSLDWLESAWPSSSVLAPPQNYGTYFAMLDDQTIIVGPTPDQSYPLRITGTWRQTPISATNETTWLSDNLPDLLFAGSMVEAYGWAKNWSALGDDPQSGTTWEKQFQEKLAGAREEDRLRKGLPPAPPGVH